jgi:hypothetical protein
VFTRIAKLGSCCRKWVTGETSRSSGAAESERGKHVRRVAEILYVQAVAGGGWAVDAGSLSPAVFRAEAAAIVDALALGTAQDGAPTP